MEQHADGVVDTAKGDLTTFVQLRLWLRRGPTGERLGAGVACLLTMVLLVWVAIPVRDGSTAVTAGPSTATGSGPASPVAGSGTAPGAAGATAGAASPAGDPTSGGGGAAAGTTDGGVPVGDPQGGGTTTVTGDTCATLGATDQGVTDQEIHIAVPVINLVGPVGNETFGVRGNVEEVVQAVVAGINAEGGVACRQLRASVYTVNPIDQNEQRARCLEIVGDQPFAVIDVGGYITPTAWSCFIEAGLPFQPVVGTNEADASASFPYLYTGTNSSDQQVRNFVAGAAARGIFDPANGFRRLGLLLDGCKPAINADLLDRLAAVGVSGGQVSAFTLACAPLSTPAEIAQAVTQHSGASHVFLAGNGSNSQSYVRQADAVGFSPSYLASDLSGETQATLSPDWPSGFDGALAITSSRVGERTSGVVHPEVDRCNAWMAAAGVEPSVDEADQNPIATCSQFRLFAAAANALQASGGGLVRASFLDGLARVGRFESGIFLDGTFDRAGKVFGADFYRAVQWQAGCACWRPLDGDVAPGAG